MPARIRSTVGVLTSLVLIAGGLLAAPSATAAPDGTGLIVNEVYGAGGNVGAVLDADFVELYNPTDAPIDLAGLALHYRSAAGGSGGAPFALSGTVPAGGHWLVSMASGANGAALPDPDQQASFNLAAAGGQVALQQGTVIIATSGSTVGVAGIVDFFGTNGSSSYETAPTSASATTTMSLNRTGGVDTDDNSADFTLAAPTPTNSGAGGEDPDPDPVAATIDEIQGEGAASPLAGLIVTTRGVVTAHYPTGGFNGYVIQTPGSGGETDATPGRSDALFVFARNADVANEVAIGQYVEVTGVVSEFNGLTEITVDAGRATVLTEEVPHPEPVISAWPATDAEREALESQLFLPAGTLTVSNTFSTNQFGEVGLAWGDEPLLQPTEVGAPGSPEAAAQIADNAARAVVLDDGATTNFLNTANTGLTPPYVSLENPVRVGATVEFASAVIVDWRNNLWKLNPTTHFIAGASAPAVFENDRTTAPRDVGGDFSIASFNVLNYFTTLGVDVPGCSSFNDRTGDPVTVNTCPGTGPRGAFEAEDLERQQDKIVAAILALDADVVGLLEIENSLVIDGVADEAAASLVEALNAVAGDGVWAHVPSSDELPPASVQDAITNALIYQPAAVELVGAPRALGTQSGSDGAFQNAREPIGAAFAPVDGGETVFVAVNHFKSKSAGEATGNHPEADAGDGQGAWNPSRIRQAEALLAWVNEITEAVDAIALVGDFNAYAQEDPLHVLYDAGYVNAAGVLAPGEYSYSFSGLSGSLDHVILNETAFARATGADVWEINAPESIALEYSRYNYHGTLFYTDDPYRSSDHDPVIVGLDDGVDETPLPPEWDPSSIYTTGDEVSYGAAVFVAQWWTSGDVPGTSPWGPWAERGADVETPAGVFPAWTPSWIYDGGEIVVHDGKRWEALWYSRGELPGANPSDAWSELGDPVSTAYGPATVWTSTAVYTGGELVTHDDLVWRASWWNRGVRPGDPNGPWQLLGPIAPHQPV